MNKIFISLLMAWSFLAHAMVSAQEPLAPDERAQVVETVSSSWEDWETVSIAGKFRMAGLPLSPSVKIYMQRDSAVSISLRAPLMGEVGRAEISTDSILVVNKMKKTYVKESLSEAFAHYPGTLSDIQELLLGRVVIPGQGLLSADIAECVELFPEADGEYSLIPGEAAELEEFNYGYLIDAMSQPAALLVIPVEKPDVNVTLSFNFFQKGYDLEISYVSDERSYSGTLELDAPQPGGTPIAPIKLNSKYLALPFSKFIKSF